MLIYVAVTQDGSGKSFVPRSRAWIFLLDVSRSRNRNKGVLKYERGDKVSLFRIGTQMGSSRERRTIHHAILLQVVVAI